MKPNASTVIRSTACLLLLASLAAPAAARADLIPVGRIQARWDDWSGASFSGTGFYYPYPGKEVLMLSSGSDSVYFHAFWSAENTSWWSGRTFRFRIRVYEVDDSVTPPVYILRGTQKVSVSNLKGSWNGSIVSVISSLGSNVFRVFRVEIQAEIEGKKVDSWRGESFPVFKWPARTVGSVGANEAVEWIYAAYGRKWAYESLRAAQDRLSAGWGTTADLWLAFLRAYGGSLNTMWPDVGFWGLETLGGVFAAFTDVYTSWILQNAWNASSATPVQKNATCNLRNQCAVEQYCLERLFYSWDSTAARKNQLLGALQAQQAELAAFGTFCYSSTSVWGTSGYLRRSYDATLDLYLTWWSTYQTRATDGVVGQFRQFLRQHSRIVENDTPYVTARRAAANRL